MKLGPEETLCVYHSETDLSLGDAPCSASASHFWHLPSPRPADVTGVTVDGEVKPEEGVKPEGVGDVHSLVENRTDGQRLTGVPEGNGRGTRGKVEGRSETTIGGAPRNDGGAGVLGDESHSGAVPVSYTDDTGSSAHSANALPFTGLPVAALAALGAAMLLTGVGLRRRAR
jgi:hypothetical protein